MATFDFTPLFRSTVGFDRVPSLLLHASQREESSYPPYNIEKCGEDQYRIVMALAGFTKDDVEIVSEQNQLYVRGKMKSQNGQTFLHRGFAARSFERQFDLADFIEVAGATMSDGLLVIELKRELPEALKPRRIEIDGSKHTRAEPSTGDAESTPDQAAA